MPLSPYTKYKYPPESPMPMPLKASKSGTDTTPQTAKAESSKIMANTKYSDNDETKISTPLCEILCLKSVRKTEFNVSEKIFSNKHINIMYEELKKLTKKSNIVKEEHINNINNNI